MKIYTDGSSSKNGQKNCKCSLGVYTDGIQFSMNLETFNNVYPELSGTKHSNNVGELLAIYVALKEFKNKEFLEIYSDSMYCINSVTVWYKNWQRNGWKNAKNEPVKNKEIIQKILELIEERNNNVFFYYTKAHRKPLEKTDPEYENWYGNDQADLLAKKAILD